MKRSDFTLLLPKQIRYLPADLAAVVALTLLTVGAVFLPVIRDTPIRILFGLPFTLFLPGYAFIAALFPEAGSSPVHSTEEPKTTADAGEGTNDGETVDSDVSQVQRTGIDGIERTALAFGTSIAIVPLLLLCLNFTPWGIRLEPIMVTVSVFTLVATSVAARRRWALPPDDRFSVPYQEWIQNGRKELLQPETRTDQALNILLIASIMLAIGSVGYAVAVPPQGEQFSEFYLLTKSDDGELVADGYPTELTRGESESIVVGITNNEYRPINYTVVAQLQEVETTAPDNVTRSNESAVDTETQVRNRQEIDRFRVQLDHNETVQESRPISPPTTGEELRLQYLLYTGEVPETPTEDNAYRSLHLWVTVSE